jgi:hypothetical protein
VLLLLLLLLLPVAVDPAESAARLELRLLLRLVLDACVIVVLSHAVLAAPLRVRPALSQSELLLE